MQAIRLIAQGVACLVTVCALVVLTACSTDQDPPSTSDPTFYRTMASANAKVDAAMAARMISGYRTNNGLSVVTVDPKLMRLAEAQAQAMAARDKPDHGVIRGFTERLRSSGYVAQVGAENIGAGYHTLAEAFSGWRDSPGHRQNMLLPGATHIGIATAYSPRSKYKVFWALILAAPDQRRG
jgi:uncharacterized protein YkwD